MFSLICVWIIGWVNNREAGDLRRYRAHYDVIIMDHKYSNVIPKKLSFFGKHFWIFVYLFLTHRIQFIGKVTDSQLNQGIIALQSRAIVIEIFWHLDTRANISVLFFVNCVFIHDIIIFYFLELYFVHWIWCLATLRYEVSNYLFVLWTKVDDAFYIFSECLELIGVGWPTKWRVTKFHNGLK